MRSLRTHHRRIDRVVGLKILRADICRSADLVRRFQREVKAAARLSHPNIVIAYDADEVRRRHFLVMEYIMSGCDLARLVTQSGPLTVPEGVECIVQVAAGLLLAPMIVASFTASEEPSNLLVNDAGVRQNPGPGVGGGCSKTFSLPTRPEASSLTVSGQIMGTIDYIARSRPATVAELIRTTDIYSLGVHLVLSADRPSRLSSRFDDGAVAGSQRIASSLATRHASTTVPDCLDEIFQRMLSQQPSQRLDSAPHTLVAALERAGLVPTHSAHELGTRVREAGKTSRRFSSRP